MPVKIVTKVFRDSRNSSYSRREIISISNFLGKRELPNEYLNSNKEVFYGEIVNDKTQRLCYSTGAPLLSSNATYFESWFQDVLKYLRKARKNLHQIHEDNGLDEIFYI